MAGADFRAVEGAGATCCVGVAAETEFITIFDPHDPYRTAEDNLELLKKPKNPNSSCGPGYLLFPWLRSSVTHNDDFQFTAKLLHSFTHERKPAPGDEKDFKDGIAPLVEAHRFGALLIQFPWSFKSSPEHWEYLVGL